MMKVKVRLDTLSDVNKFVGIASGISADVYLTDSKHFTVNAKSILAVMYTMEWSEVYCTCEKNIYYSIQDYVIEE